MAWKVNDISVTFDSVGENSTFTNGDYITGRVILEVAKEIHIESLYVTAKGEASVLWSEHKGRYNVVVYHDKVLCFTSILHLIQEQTKGRVRVEVVKETHIQELFIKAKGKASVLWSENHGNNNIVVYYDKETCFKSIQYFIQDQKTKGQDGYSLLTNECGECYSRIVGPGTHVYPFTFQIPHQDMPASFKGYHGKVVYFLEAKLCRSLKITKKDKVYFNYVPRGDMSVPDLMMSQHGFKEKKMKFLTTGSVTMDVRTEKMGFQLGEQITVKIDVVNNSSRTVKPKLTLYQKQSFFASKKRNVRTKKLLKEKGNPINPSTKQTVTMVLDIPADISVSILNCRVLKVEYRLKVNLDIKFAHNPEVKLPLVFLPVCVTQEDKDLLNTDLGIGFESASKQSN